MVLLLLEYQEYTGTALASVVHKQNSTIKSIATASRQHSDSIATAAHATVMLAADAANPAVEAPLAQCADGKEGSSSESSDGAPGGSSSSGDDYDNTGSSSPIAARAAALARSPRPAVVDRHESVSLLALSRLPSWRSWGGVDGVGGSIPEEEGSGVGKPAAERGPSYHCQVSARYT